MYNCDICGREVSKKIRLHGHTLCSKHMHQMFKYGYCLDNNPRTNSDLNDFVVNGDTTTFNVYNQRNEFVGTFDIDTEDVEKVRYHKWRFSHDHVVTGQPARGEQRDLAHVVLDFKANGVGGLVVDHKDGNPMNNKKCNLRICTQSENTLNKSIITSLSGFAGVFWAKDKGKYAPEIMYGKQRLHLCAQRNLEDAVYERYIAEQILFGEYMNEAEHKRKQEFTKNLPIKRKEYLKQITVEKIQSHFGDKLCGSAKYAEQYNGGSVNNQIHL